MTTMKSLLEERDKAIKDAHDIVRGANAAGELLSAEQNEQISKLREAAAAAEARSEQIALEESLTVRKEERAADEDRSRFHADPAEQEQADLQAEDGQRKFRNWLAGDTSELGRSITFNLNQAAPYRRAKAGDNATLYSENKPGEFRALGIGTSAGGGATVPTPFLNYLYDYRETYSTFRALGARELPTSTGADYEFPVVTAHGTAANAGNPPAALPENTAIGGTDPTFEKLTLKAYKAGQVVGLSNEIILDTEVPLEAWLAEDMGRAIARIEDIWFYLGTGTNMPQGVVNGGFGTARVGTATKGGTGSTVPAKIEYQDLTAVIASIDDSYGAFNTPTPQPANMVAAPELKWVMDKSTLQEIWLTEDNNGQFIFQPYLAQGFHNTIMGHPYITAPNLPDFARGADVLYFGAWRDAIILRDVGMVTLAYSDDAEFKSDQRVYRVTCRVDSRVRDTRAVNSFRTRAA